MAFHRLVFYLRIVMLTIALIKNNVEPPSQYITEPLPKSVMTYASIPIGSCMAAYCNTPAETVNFYFHVQ